MKRVLIFTLACMLIVPGFISCKKETKIEKTQTEAKEQLSQDSISADKYREAAEQGLAPAQYNLGVCYENGQGVEQDYTQAAQWYRKAAEQGLAEAQYNLGVCYYNGDGVEQDYTQAVYWFRKAAEQGLAEAQAALKRLVY
jgi:TPR repeat protein